MTEDEALELIHRHRPDLILEKPARYVLRTRSDGQWIAVGEVLVEVLVKGGVPIPIDSEEDAVAAAQAKLGPLAAVYDGGDEKLVGIMALLREVGPRGEIAVVPVHGLHEIRGRGFTWAAALRGGQPSYNRT